MSIRIGFFAVGNPARGDDAIGPWLAEKLNSLDEPFQAQTIVFANPIDMLDRFLEFDAVIIVDAAVGESKLAYCLYRIHRTGLPGFLLARRASSHQLGLAETLLLADSLSRLPKRLYLGVLFSSKFQLESTLDDAKQIHAMALARRIICLVKALVNKNNLL